MKLLFVDRVNENGIICEDSDGLEVVLNFKDVLGQVKEGDVIRIDDNDNISVDYEETRKRKEKVFKLHEKLKNIGK